MTNTRSLLALLLLVVVVLVNYNVHSIDNSPPWNPCNPPCELPDGRGGCYFNRNDCPWVPEPLILPTPPPVPGTVKDCGPCYFPDINGRCHYDIKCGEPYFPPDAAPATPPPVPRTVKDCGPCFIADIDGRCHYDMKCGQPYFPPGAAPLTPPLAGSMLG